MDLIVRAYELVSVDFGTKEFVGYFLLGLSILGIVAFLFGLLFGLPLLTSGALIVASTIALCGVGGTLLLTIKK